MTHNTNKNLIKIFLLFTVLFIMLIGYMGYFVFFQSKTLVNNPYNPRMSALNQTIRRGDIVDRNGVVLATSVKEGEQYKRQYPFGRQFAHITGYVSPSYSGGSGKLAVESNYNFTLQELHFDIVQRARKILTGSELQGNGLRLTIDAELQKYAYETLGERKGAVLIMEPTTGKILAQVSYPAFDPNTLNIDWDNIKDDDNSPLLNRATQGLYPPGSVFKMVTAAAIMDSLDFYDGKLQYECTGKANFSEKYINCFNSKVHGNENLKKAFAVSCNTFFAHFINEKGAGKLMAIADHTLFNKPLEYSLDYNISKFSLTESSSESEILETAIGQGKTLVTPLHIAMIASSVSNSGMMMKPYIVESTIYGNSSEGNVQMPQVLTNAFTQLESQKLLEYMEEVVKTGTGMGSDLSPIQVAAKTGTAENSSGDDHSWFVAFAPSENPKACVVVLLENAGSGSGSASMAGKLLSKAIACQDEYYSNIKTDTN